ncbi:hypothetical protein ACE6H2_020143 [Prunus campanulata]
MFSIYLMAHVSKLDGMLLPPTPNCISLSCNHIVLILASSDALFCPTVPISEFGCHKEYQPWSLNSPKRVNLQCNGTLVLNEK